MERILAFGGASQRPLRGCLAQHMSGMSALRNFGESPCLDDDSQKFQIVQDISFVSVVAGG